MKSSTILLIIGTLVVAAGIYWYASSGTGNQSPLTTVASGNSAQTRFQALVSELKPISFNTDIFSDPRFLSLADLTTPVAPEPSGRLDPFAVVPGVTGK